MAVVQISRIQHRQGSSGELPNALDNGEIGFTTDTGEAFFGASFHPSVSGRRSYPYQNIKLLTELDVQYGIKGNVYYHGPLVGARCAYNNVWVSVVPLFKHGTRDFANYDFSLSGNNRTSKVMGTLNACVHPTNSALSSVTATELSWLNWTPARGALNQDVFRLTNLDSEGNDTGTTWLAFRNNLNLELVLSLSGREWSNPTT